MDAHQSQFYLRHAFPCLILLHYQDVDKDNSGRLSFDNFLNLMSTKMSEKDTKEEILKAFKLFDDDDTGRISFDNLKRVANELGENLTDEELQVS